MNAFLPEVLFWQLDTFVSSKLMDAFFFNRNRNCDYFGLWTRFYKKVLSDYRKYCINCYIQLSTIITSQSMEPRMTYIFVCSIFDIYIIWSIWYGTEDATQKITWKWKWSLIFFSNQLWTLRWKNELACWNKPNINLRDLKQYLIYDIKDIVNSI